MPDLPTALTTDGRKYLHLLSFVDLLQVTGEDKVTRPAVFLLDEDGESLHTVQEPLIFEKPIPLPPDRIFNTVDAHGRPIKLINMVTEFAENQFRYHKTNIHSLGGPGTADQVWANLELSDGRGNMDPIHIPTPTGGGETLFKLPFTLTPDVRKYILLLSFAKVGEEVGTDRITRPAVFLLDEDGESLHTGKEEPLVFEGPAPLPSNLVFDTLDAHDRPIKLINKVTEFTESQFRYHKANIPSLGGAGTADEIWSNLELSDGRSNMDPIHKPPPTGGQ